MNRCIAFSRLLHAFMLWEACRIFSTETRPRTLFQIWFDILISRARRLYEGFFVAWLLSKSWADYSLRAYHKLHETPSAPWDIGNIVGVGGVYRDRGLILGRFIALFINISNASISCYSNFHGSGRFLDLAGCFLVGDHFLLLSLIFKFLYIGKYRFSNAASLQHARFIILW